MERLHVVLVEPDDVEGLYPFSLTHGAWEIRLGYFTLAQRWMQSIPGYKIYVHTNRLQILAASEFQNDESLPFAGGPQLFIMSTFVTSPGVMRQIVSACEASETPLHFTVGSQTAALFVRDGGSTLEEAISKLDAIHGDDVSTINVTGHLVTRMWQTLDLLADAIAWDAELLGPNRVDSSATIHPMSAIDDTNGPVIIGPNVVIHPFVVISGPCSIGEFSTVKPHTHITHSSIGPQCRVAGEISCSIFQGFGNKQHEGFVGHSYFGEWINLGAGTTTSNLKTTYSHVRVAMPWGREDSQRMFLGTLMGDFSRTSIGTRFNTGTVVGSNSAVFADQGVPPLTRSFSWGQDRYHVDNALATAKVVMDRRGRILTPECESLLRTVHDEDR